MTDLQDNIINYILAPIAAAFGGWFFGRRKLSAEASTTEIENVEKSLAIYRGIITDMESQIKSLKSQITELETQLNLFKAKRP
ncbi:MAG: hypothetical protein M9958_00475 [Chitinophagales bacterium]|nr:hypothetical protein [Chitinophagales bacterium]